jgi:hypothetical protein
LQDWLDIVATQGAYLVPRAGTPVSQEAYDDQFAAVLNQHLDAVIIEQKYRREMYHGVADEWPMGHTPPEVKEKRKAELKAQEELEGGHLTIAATATTITETKTKAVMILTPKSVRGDQWQHQTGPGGRGGHAKQTGSQHHRCPSKALWPHHIGGSGGGYPRKTRRRNSTPVTSTSALPGESRPLQKMLCPT